MTASSKMWRAISLMLTGMQIIFLVVDIPVILLCNWHCNTANWPESGWSFNKAAYFCILTGLTSLKFLKGTGGVSASHSGLLARKVPLWGSQQRKQVSASGMAKKLWFPMGVSCLVYRGTDLSPLSFNYLWPWQVELKSNPLT